VTTTIEITWDQPDERPDGREDSAWYTFGHGHDLVATVRQGERTISVYADGEMDMSVVEKQGDSFQEIGRVRYCEQLAEFGITQDNDLWGLEPVENEYDLSGPNRAGLYFRIHHNSWFDLYSEDGEHLDCVCHTLTEAIEQATKIINDDNDELWNELVNIKEIWNELRKDGDSDV